MRGEEGEDGVVVRTEEEGEGDARDERGGGAGGDEVAVEGLEEVCGA